MNNFALEVWYDEGSSCTFYTVKWEAEEYESQSETDKFFNSYAVSGHALNDEAFQLFRLITESIGNRYGAIDDFFDRFENRAQALPPKPKKRVYEISLFDKNFPLRLYCYRVSHQIVVLFNGGVKSAGTAQQSKDLSMKFIEAQWFAKRIENAIMDKVLEITPDGKYLQTFDKQSQIIL